MAGFTLYRPFAPVSQLSVTVNSSASYPPGPSTPWYVFDCSGISAIRVIASTPDLRITGFEGDTLVTDSSGLVQFSSGAALRGIGTWHADDSGTAPTAPVSNPQEAGTASSTLFLVSLRYAMIFVDAVTSTSVTGNISIRLLP